MLIRSFATATCLPRPRLPIRQVFTANQARTLLDIVGAVARHRERERLFRAIGDALRGVLPFDTLGVTTEGPGPDEFTPYFIEPRMTMPVLERRKSALLSLFENGEPYHVRCREEVLDRPTSLMVLERTGSHSFLALPLHGRDRVIAALVLMSKQRCAYEHVDAEFALHVALIIGLALESCLAYEELDGSHRRLRAENTSLREALRAATRPAPVVLASASMQEVMRLVALVAPTDATVLITGETGSGKEVVARAIHEQSLRAARPLVKVNCAVMPTALVESELFGHEHGAFTDAGRRRKGRFELADHGTIFLDEIGELPLEAQAKLLRVLQTREFERIGGARTLHTDTRVIAATNRDLGEMVAEGTFRADLYYRLSVFPVELAPLRERSEDIGPLALAFAAEQAARHGRPPPVIDEITVATLTARPWPGNVRELQNVIERAVILSRGDRLVLDGLPEVAEGDEARVIEDALARAGGRIEGEGGAAELLGVRPSTLRSRLKRLRRR